MYPLPPEDGLEGFQAHARVDVMVLGDLPVLGEHIEPIGLRERRHDADDGLPLGDREAGPGQPCHTANADHQEYQSRHHEQPGSQTCALAGSRWGGLECVRLRHGGHNDVLLRLFPCGAWASAMRNRDHVTGAAPLEARCTALMRANGAPLSSTLT